MDYFPGRQAYAGNKHARANLAVCIATTAEYTPTEISVPEPWFVRGWNLFATSLEEDCYNPDAALLAARLCLNLIVGHYDPRQGMTHPARYRIRLRGSPEWRTFRDYVLWQPDDGRAVCFVPAGPADVPWFRVELGSLVSASHSLWRDEADRRRGRAAADRLISRLMLGC